MTSDTTSGGCDLYNYVACAVSPIHYMFSDYPVECGCGQTPSVCLVARGKHPATLAYKVSGGVASDDDYHHRYVCSLIIVEFVIL